MSLQRISGLVLCLMVLFATGCGQGPDAVTEDTVTVTPGDVVDPSPFTGEVVVDDTGMAIDQWGGDDYEIATGDGEAPVIEDDTLTLTVSYGGGCETHDFTLVTSGVFMESYPVQLGVSVAHDANGDMCEAYLTAEYEFDLTPIKTLYQDAYRTDTGTIVLRLQDAPEMIPDLTYTFGS